MYPVSYSVVVHTHSWILDMFLSLLQSSHNTIPAKWKKPHNRAYVPWQNPNKCDKNITILKQRKIHRNYYRTQIKHVTKLCVVYTNRKLCCGSKISAFSRPITWRSPGLNICGAAAVCGPLCVEKCIIQNLNVLDSSYLTFGICRIWEK